MDFKVTQNGIRLSEFLKNCGFSRRTVSRLKFEDGILVNGIPQFTDYILHESDTVTVVFPSKKSENVLPQDIPLDILYEDEHLLAVNKPAFMPIHPSHGHSFDTLANAVSGYYVNHGIESAVRIYGRLDKDTSGVVLISKNPLAAKIMSETETNKYYLAVVDGKISESGVVDAPILDLKEGMRRVVSPQGKHAVTKFEPLEITESFTLLKLKLITGRTHQIRVHMLHIGHPIAGDFLYGGSASLTRQALHAHILEFPHPITKEMLKITAPMPDDMKKLID